MTDTHNDTELSNDLSARLSGLSEAKRKLLEQRLQQPGLTGFQLLAIQLAELKITHVYALVGSPVAVYLHAIDMAHIKVICTRHQQAAVLMAASHNFLAGKLQAVAMVSPGPALTNTLTGILVARDNAWPVILLGSRRAETQYTDRVFQYLEGVPVFESLCKYSQTISSVKDVQQVLVTAYHQAMTGQPGPVFVELPEDIMATYANQQMIEVPEKAEVVQFENQSIKVAAKKLQNAKRPLVIVGPGIRWANSHNKLLSLLEQTNTPFITMPLIQGYLPDSHRLCFNHARHQMWMQADAIIIAGNAIDWTLRFGSEFTRDADIIHLAFQSSVSKGISNPVVHLSGDPGELLIDILQFFAAELEGSESREFLSLWHDQAQQFTKKSLQDRDRFFDDNNNALTVHHMAQALNECIPENAITILDGNKSMLAAQAMISCDQPESRLMAGFNGCMGTGLPYAIAAKIRRPERAVIVVAGDVAFSFSAMELETAVRLNVPVIIVIANNGGQANYLNSCHSSGYSYESFGAMSPKLRFDQFAISLGAHGAKVESSAELKAALSVALAKNVPAVIDVKINSAVFYKPRRDQ
jgi:2-hydroxyacyl-CoA lyase 1